MAYGIPRGQSLIGSINREKRVKNAKILIADGKIKPHSKGEQPPHQENPTRRPAPACVNDSMRKWRREDYEAIADKMRTQRRNFKDVCGDPDLPGYCSSLEYLKRHPELKEKIRRIQFTFSYSEQFKVHVVSHNFQKDCRSLRAGGMTIANIAKNLGVSRNPVERVLRGFEMNPAKPPDWGRKDFEKILDRIHEQRRSLKDVCEDPDLPNKDAWIKYVKKHPGKLWKMVSGKKSSTAHLY